MDPGPDHISAARHSRLPDRHNRPDSAPADALADIALELTRLASALVTVNADMQPPQPTSATREALSRLGAQANFSPSNRIEFFTAAAEAIRTAVVNRARLAPPDDPGPPRRGASPGELLALDKAFDALKAHDHRLHDVAAIRYFIGLSDFQAAAVLGVPADVVAADWCFARAWLLRQVHRRADNPGPEQAA